MSQRFASKCIVLSIFVCNNPKPYIPGLKLVSDEDNGNFRASRPSQTNKSNKMKRVRHGYNQDVICENRVSRRKSNREEAHKRQNWDCHIPRSANVREARMSGDALAMIDSIDTQTDTDPDTDNINTQTVSNQCLIFFIRFNIQFKFSCQKFNSNKLW